QSLPSLLPTQHVLIYKKNRATIGLETVIEICFSE
ncbi:hypothetical protein scyTo_0005679, partial [Scyliorhinus torazame]|nr:hypothetical protein [Scyliorhinus torazame]